MDKETNITISNFIAAVAQKYPTLKKVYLFGSYARKLNRPESDIDIAFILENLENKDIFNVQVQLLVTASNFDTRIEPHPVSSVDFAENKAFVSEIKKYGIEIEPQNQNMWKNI